MGVIELRPPIGISPQEPIEKLKPFSTPFRIENTGYLSFYVEHVFCYIRKIEVDQQLFEGDVIDFPELDDLTFGRGDSGTITCDLFKGTTAQHIVTEIVIVVDYKPFKAFPKSFRKYFRFQGAYVDNWQWLQEPSPGIEDDVDKNIAFATKGTN